MPMVRFCRNTGVPQPKNSNEPIDQSGGGDESLFDKQSRKETAARCGGIYGFS
jgi:hypothetical protein